MSKHTQRSTRRSRRKQREHRPQMLGPRPYPRGKVWYGDMRPFGGERIPLRDPSAPGWPKAGPTTSDEATARRWVTAYHDYYRLNDEQRAREFPGLAAPLGVEVERFLVHVKRVRATMTYSGYRSVLTVHLVPKLGAHTAVDTIDSKRMQEWANALIDDDYEVSTVTAYLKVAQVFFKWQSDEQRDPTKGVELPDEGERDVQPWSDARIEKLRKAADQLDAAPRVKFGRAPLITSYRLTLEAFLGTGGRLRELAALDWDAFNPAEKTVRFQWQVSAEGEEGLQPLKGRRNRTALVLPSFWAHYEDGATGRVVLREGVTEMSGRTLAGYVDEILKKAGLKGDGVNEGVNAHSLRHTYSRLVLEGNARLEQLQQFLGHSSIATTEKYYGHLTTQAAVSLARAAIYGEAPTLRLVTARKPRRAAS